MLQTMIHIVELRSSFYHRPLVRGFICMPIYVVLLFASSKLCGQCNTFKICFEVNKVW